MRNAFLLSVAMMVTGCVGPQAQVGVSVPSADGRVIVGPLPNLVSIRAGYVDIGGGSEYAAYVIDRSANLCYFWTTQKGFTGSGILIDCCRLRKIPAAVAVFQTMTENCGDAAPALPATSVPAAR